MVGSATSSSHHTEGPSDPPRLRIDLPTGPAAYTDEGSANAPVLVALHGLPGSGRDFRWLAPRLVPDLRVIRLDLPGFGETPLATEPDPSPSGRARYALAVIHALGLEDVLLLGHSMGGVVACAAVHLADTAQQPVGLVLVSSPGVRTHAMLRGKPYGLISRMLGVPGLATLMRPLVRQGFRSMGFPRYPDGELIHTLHCVAHTSMERHAERVHGLTLPTCVVWCDDDPLIERDKLQGLAEACPPGPRLQFARGGHNPQKSHAGRMAETLIAWRSDLSG